MLKYKIKLVLIGFKSLYWELSKLYKILNFLNSQYSDSKFTVQLFSKIISFLIVKIRLNKLCTNIECIKYQFFSQFNILYFYYKIIQMLSIFFKTVTSDF